jgi:methylthioribose-1-phosphate isomerase
VFFSGMSSRNEVPEAGGLRPVSPRASVYYPAFDVTPPIYASSIVTNRDTFPTGRMAVYFDGQTPSARSGQEGDRRT